MIYLDHAASAPCAPQVIDAMLPWFSDQHANASSPHRAGRAARGAVEAARSRVASLCGVEPARVVFTSGSTEALNGALRGIAALADDRREEVWTSPTEHKAVLDTIAALPLTRRDLPVDSVGRPHVPGTELDESTLVVVAMAANNETGALTDIVKASAAAHEVGALFLCDVTQAAGRVPLRLSADGVDFASLSAHKLGGPQGIGALIVPTGQPPAGWVAHQSGGGHERGWRSGTLNVPAIVGMGEAARLAAETLTDEADRQRELRDLLERELVEVGGKPLRSGPRLPNITSIRFDGIDGHALISNVPEVAFATGSACTSAVPTPSHVLTAAGHSADEADATVRFSVGRTTTRDDIERAAALLRPAVERLHGMLK